MTMMNWFTPDEAAKFLGKSRRTIDRWVQQGHLSFAPNGIVRHLALMTAERDVRCKLRTSSRRASAAPQPQADREQAIREIRSSKERFSLEEAAAHVGRSTRTILEWEKRGLITFVVGRTCIEQLNRATQAIDGNLRRGGRPRGAIGGGALSNGSGPVS